MPKMNLERKVVAFGDVTSNSNPRLKYVDWHRSNAGLEVSNPDSKGYTLQAGETLAIFDGQRTLLTDGTTEFSLASSSVEDGRYRLTWSGGTNPVIRTDRAVAIDGIALTLVSNNNGTLTVTAGSGTPFSGTSTGDSVLVAGTSTGDSASPFNSLNEGFWVVLAKTSTVLTLVRPTGVTYEGASEVVTPTDDSQFIVYSATGVQKSDKVQISAGFVASARNTYSIVAVSPSWIEITSTSPLAAESGIIPGASGLKVFKSSKRFLQIEADQEVIVRLNGTAEDVSRISPILSGDPEQVGWFAIFGAVGSLSLVNAASVAANVIVITAE